MADEWAHLDTTTISDGVSLPLPARHQRGEGWGLPGPLPIRWGGGTGVGLRRAHTSPLSPLHQMERGEAASRALWVTRHVKQAEVVYVAVEEPGKPVPVK